MKMLLSVLFVTFSLSRVWASEEKTPDIELVPAKVMQTVMAKEAVVGVTLPSLDQKAPSPVMVSTGSLQVATSTFVPSVVSTRTLVVLKLYRATDRLFDKWDAEVSHHKSLSLSFGFGLRTLSDWDTSSQPAGFQTKSSDDGRPRFDFSVELKYNMVAVQWLPQEHKRTINTEFYGTSLEGPTAKTGNRIVGRIYVLDTKTHALTVGFGYEHTKLDGGVSIGGVRFPAEGGGWNPVFQLGYQYHLNRLLSVAVEYDRLNNRVSTPIPGVDSVVSTEKDCFYGGFILRAF